MADGVSVTYFLYDFENTLSIIEQFFMIPLKIPPIDNAFRECKTARQKRANLQSFDTICVVTQSRQEHHFLPVPRF